MPNTKARFLAYLKDAGQEHLYDLNALYAIGREIRELIVEGRDVKIDKVGVFRIRLFPPRGRYRAPRVYADKDSESGYKHIVPLNLKTSGMNAVMAFQPLRKHEWWRAKTSGTLLGKRIYEAITNENKTYPIHKATGIKNHR